MIEYTIQNGDWLTMCESEKQKAPNATNNNRSSNCKTSTQQAYENAREIISNENELARNRMTAFLTLQGFLFAAFGLGFRVYLDESNLSLLCVSVYLFQLAISITGSLSALIFYEILRRAYKHIDATRFWFYYHWHTKRKEQSEIKFEENQCPPFPSLTGGGEYKEDYIGYYKHEEIGEDYSNSLKIILIEHDIKHKTRSSKKDKEKLNKLHNSKNTKNTPRVIPVRKRFYELGALGVVKLLKWIWFISFVWLIVIGLFSLCSINPAT